MRNGVPLVVSRRRNSEDSIFKGAGAGAGAVVRCPAIKYARLGTEVVGVRRRRLSAVGWF